MTDQEIINNIDKILNNEISGISPQKKTYIRKICTSKDSELIINKIANGKISLHKAYLEATGLSRSTQLTKSKKEEMGKFLSTLIFDIERDSKSLFQYNHKKRELFSHFITLLASTYDSGFINEKDFIKSLSGLLLIDNSIIYEIPKELREKYVFLDFDKTALREIIHDDKKLEIYLQESS